MTNETRDLEAFIRLVDELDIRLSESSDGVFTVCTTSEPLFCYDSESKEELGALVVDTLVSYAKHFYHLDLTGGRTEATTIAEAPLEVERVTPVGRLKPIFDLAA